MNVWKKTRQGKELETLFLRIVSSLGTGRGLLHYVRSRGANLTVLSRFIAFLLAFLVGAFYKNFIYLSKGMHA